MHGLCFPSYRALVKFTPKREGQAAPAMRIDRTHDGSSETSGARGVGRVSYVRDIRDVEQIPADERERLATVADRFVFRANDYYLSLIDWNDEADPIRRLIIPSEDELCEWGALDASNEASNTVMPGVQHKYRDTALLLAVEACGGYCRYCFRKRLFMRDNHEVSRDLDAGIDYIEEHPEITDVLLTGGDPLLLATAKLAHILTRLREIPHVRQIRIGTKMFAFDPFRILDDPELQQLIQDETGPGGRIYFMCHFDHPREFTEPAMEAVDRVRRLGAMAVNQVEVEIDQVTDAERIDNRVLVEHLGNIGPVVAVAHVEMHLGSQPQLPAADSFEEQLDRPEPRLAFHPSGRAHNPEVYAVRHPCLPGFRVSLEDIWTGLQQGALRTD
jgi:KamA family protein